MMTTLIKSFHKLPSYIPTTQLPASAYGTLCQKFHTQHKQSQFPSRRFSVHGLLACGQTTVCLTLSKEINRPNLKVKTSDLYLSYTIFLHIDTCTLPIAQGHIPCDFSVARSKLNYYGSPQFFLFFYFYSCKQVQFYIILNILFSSSGPGQVMVK